MKLKPFQAAKISLAADPASNSYIKPKEATSQRHRLDVTFSVKTELLLRTVKLFRGELVTSAASL